ncbi:MAG: class I tRNA ligase family protein, partial [Rhodospirillaceae bacterium]|nr:class I tRNA ligase family protein [Rhodospirillaceae bacterium]
PKQWENTFFEWMRNIQPWCISRQLWWGHQIPAWYGPDNQCFVAMDEAEAYAVAKKHYGKDVDLRRDEDVLDTWFSSALWPFSTLGWPDKTPELARYYPGDVLVTGFDIIFFWVARMMMMGLHFMKDVPFKDVYIHALVRDEKGQKMSKSKGNVLDPLDLCNKYGTDAVRFTLTAMAAQGRDIKLSEQRIAGYRNFITKIWNATRFAQMNECKPVAGFDPKAVTTTLNKWIVGKTAECATTVAQAIEAYRFNDAADGLYRFTWGSFCDWFLEFAKPVFAGSDENAKAETRATAAWVLEQILHIGQPIIPFVTEELWSKLGQEYGVTRPYRLIQAPWPTYTGLNAPEAEAEIDWVIDVISAIRSVRSEMNIPPGQMLKGEVVGASPIAKSRLGTHAALICANARLSEIGVVAAPTPGGSAQVVVGDTTVMLPLAGIVDLAKERERLKKEIAKAEGDIAAVDKKLGNEAFVSKAPPEIIEENRERRRLAAETKAKLSEALARIG